jgi:hypothetical protein
MSKNQRVVKLRSSPRSFGSPQTSGGGTGGKESQPSKSSPSALVSPSGQQPKVEAAHPQPNPLTPPAGDFRSGQQPYSVSLQLHPS